MNEPEKVKPRDDEPHVAGIICTCGKCPDLCVGTGKVNRAKKTRPRKSPNVSLSDP